MTRLLLVRDVVIITSSLLCAFLLILSAFPKLSSNLGSLDLLSGKYEAAWRHYSCLTAQSNGVGCLRAAILGDYARVSSVVSATPLSRIPDFVWLWTVRTVLPFYRNGDHERVIDTLSPLTTADLPVAAWREGMQVLALSYLAVNRELDAQVVYESLANQYPHAQDWPVFQAYIFLGQEEMDAGRFEQAAKRLALAYDMALQIDPSARADYEKSAWTLMGKFTELASSELLEPVVVEAICNAMPDSPGCRFLLGRLTVAAKDTAGAQQTFLQACSLALSAERVRLRQQSLYMAAAAECSEVAEP